MSRPAIDGKKISVFAGGTVTLRGVGKKTEVLVVHRNLRDDWSLPKGKLDKGELLSACAVRETLEETAVATTLGIPLTAIQYMSMGKPKLVRYWVAKPSDQAIASGDIDVPETFIPNDEVDEVRWIRVSQAKAILSYAQDVKTLNEAMSMPRFSSPLVLLRHSDAEKRATYAERHDGNPPPDDYRPLTEEGMARTPAIADALRAFGIQVSYSSPAKRCMSTITPSFVSEDDVVQETSFSEWGFSRDSSATMDRIRDIKRNETPLVICSHRPVLPTLMRGVASKHTLPSRKLKAGDFVVFHRSLKDDGTIRKNTILSVEHSAENY